MTSIVELVRRLHDEPGCRVAAPGAVPEARPGHTVPGDVMEFYRLAGGATIFSGKDYEYNVLPPGEIRPANDVLIVTPHEPDISDSWYVIIDDGNGDYLTIDFDPARIGRCYDSFHETHATVGDSPIIARSFTELLERLLENRGEYPYWLRDDFDRLGDAYDDAPPDAA